MTANQRRPGFRMPWSSELGDSPDEAAASAPDERAAADQPAAVTASSNGSGAPASAEVAAVHAEAAASPDFMRELVEAMRKVADEAREAGAADARARAEAEVSRLESVAERRRAELQAAAEHDIAGVGEWAQSEAARIRSEAEQRVAARRSQLDQQIAADAARLRDEASSVRERAASYEQELEAYHAQLIEIEDPTAFAAAAKRMPQPPAFDATDGGVATPASVSNGPSAAPAAMNDAPAQAQARAQADAQAAPVAEPVQGADPGPEVHPAEEQVLAAPEVAASPSAHAAEPSAPPPAEASRGEPVTTDVVVKGLGSFGAITGFRQTLAAADGIDGVALSLGQTGEFVFRATHQPSLDVAAVIHGLEGEAARIEPQGERSFLVTLDRAR